MQAFVLSKFLILVVILAACSSSSTKEESEDVDPAEIENTPDLRFPILKLQVSVNDFESWLNTYNNSQEIQSQSDIQTLGIYRDTEIQNKVHLFISADDLSTLKKYLTTTAFKSLFNNPSQQIEEKAFIDVIELTDDKFNQDYRLLISHRVKDYLEWKPHFDADAPNRASHDLSLIGIGRDFDDPAMIYIMFAYNDENKVEAFIHDEELKERMERAGVVGELELARLIPIQITPR